MADYFPPEHHVADVPIESWSAPGIKPALFTNIAGGFLYGICIGFLPVMFQFNQYLGDCSRYTSQDACDALTYTGCVWVPSNFTSSPSSSNGFCGFPDHSGVNCSNFFSQDECSDSHGGDSCYWRYHKKQCDHLVGWDSNQQGLLAGIQIVGAMIAAATAGPITNKIGRKKSLALAGLITAIACVFFTAGWADKENYEMLLIAELLVGLAAGAVSVVCPMYCGEMVHGSNLQQGIGVAFQINVTFGIFVVGAVGLVLDPKDDTATSDAQLQNRFQWVNAVQWFTAIIMFPLAWWIPESPLWSKQQQMITNSSSPSEPSLDENSALIAQTESEQQQDLLRQQPAEEPESNHVADLFTRENALPLLVGCAMAVAFQFTGINALSEYSFSIASKLGVSPMMGNFAFATWNFVTCFLPIPLVRYFTCRQIFITSTALACVSCLVAGLGLTPGIFEHDSVASHVVGVSGIVVFVMAFEGGLGPCFYVLAQDIFPARVRSLGTSYCVWVLFTCNLVINWGFPVAVTGLSGGPSGNQNKGLSTTFFLFSGFGLLCFLFLVFKMPKANSEHKEAAKNSGIERGAGVVVQN